MGTSEHKGTGTGNIMGTSGHRRWHVTDHLVGGLQETQLPAPGSNSSRLSGIRLGRRPVHVGEIE